MTKRAKELQVGNVFNYAGSIYKVRGVTNKIYFRLFNQSDKQSSGKDYSFGLKSQQKVEVIE